MSASCRDCDTDTTPCTGKRGCRHGGRWEWYMVRERVWARAGMPADLTRPDFHAGFLCIGCLERRLGRPLTYRDFPDRPVNWPSPWDTDRLAEAKDRLPD